MKTLSPFVALILVWAATTFAQTSTVDILYLKNGSIIRGQVVELASGNVKIKTADGSLFVYSMTEVEKMIKETSTPTPAAVPPPAPIQTPIPSTEPIVTPAAPVQETPAPVPVQKVKRSKKELAEDQEVQETLPPAPTKKVGVSFALRGGLFANLEMWNNLGKNSMIGLNGEPDSKIGFGLMGLLTAGIDIDDDMYLGVGPHFGGNFWRHSETIAQYQTSVQITPLDFGADFAFGFDNMYFVFGIGSSSISVTAEVGNDSKTVEIPDKAPYKRFQVGWSDGLGIGFSIVSYAEPFENLGRIEFNLGFTL